MAQVRSVSFQPTTDCLRKAYVIVANCQKTLTSLLGIFDNPGGHPRGAGVPSDAEQDLLRAMLVLAGAGLDSMLKQVIRDSLTDGIIKIDSLRKDFMQYSAGKFIKKSASGEYVDTHLLAQLFMDALPKDRMIGNYAESRTSSSLQSKEELLRVTRSLGLQPSQVTPDLDKLDAAFRARNQIVHEMDVDFSVANRSRRQRRRDDMVDFANLILDTAERILSSLQPLLT